MAFLISLGKINKNLIYPIIAGIAPIINLLIIKRTNPSYVNYPFIVIIITGICLLFSIIPLLISNRLNKGGQKFNITRRIKVHKFVLIFLTTIFDFVETLLDNFYEDLKVSQIILINFILITLFSYFILKIKLYKHQYFSMIIIFICGIVLFIIEPLFSKKFKITLLQLFFEICFCLIFVLSKYLMEYKFCSPYEICFYHGILFVLFTGISYIFFRIYGQKHVDFSEYKLDCKEILGMFSFVIFTFIFNLFIYITLRIYNPFYVMFIFIIIKIELTFMTYEIGWKLYIIIILLCVLIFIMLVFNEILILNFCGLEKNIRINLEQKALEENMEKNRESKIEIEEYKVELLNKKEEEED